MKCISCFRLDDEFKPMLDRMLKSLTHFHPEVNIELCVGPNFGPINYYFPSTELPLFKKYNTVTHVDADVLVVDRIDDLFDDSTDVRAGRNNSDNGRCATNVGVSIPNVGINQYINAGVHSISNEQFMYDWYYDCKKYSNFMPYGEQDILNELFHSGEYNCKILDPIDSSIHYGSSFTEGTHTYWDLWKNIVVNNDHLELNGKRVKMLHIAGGSIKKPELWELVTPQVEEFINSVIH